MVRIPSAIKSVIAAAALALLAAQPAQASTQVSGTIATSTEWDVSGSPYILTGNLTVASGVVLTVDAGVTIKSSSYRFSVFGQLLAEGTPSSPITFTSNNANPAAGDWCSLNFATGSNEASQLSYVTVEYAGFWDNAGLYIQSGSPVLDHVTVSTTAGIGVLLTGGSLSITDSTITQSTGVGLDVRSGAAVTAISGTISDNGGYAVIARPGAALCSLASVTMTGNSGGNGNVLAYQGGTINGTQAWHGGAPVLTLGDIEVASGAVLMVDAGTTVKMGNGTRLKVYGKLAAVGTEGSPITFTSSQATPSPGNWCHLYFSTGANPASQLSYVTVAYAGNWDAAGVYIQSGSPVFDHVTVTNTSGSGIRQTGGSPALDHVTVTSSSTSGILLTGGSLSITDTTITQSSGVGLDVRSGAAVTAISGTISNNGGYAVSARPGAALCSLASVTMTGNSGGNGNVLAYQGGTINGTQAWHGGAPVLTLGDLEVASGAVLTVDAGTTVKMGNGTRLKVYGKLAAVGTEGSPIAFTSSQATPAPGNWCNLYFSTGGNPASQLSYVTVAYAGASDAAGIYIQSGSPALDHVTVTSTSGSGIRQTGGSSTLVSGTVTTSSTTGILLTGGSLSLTDSTITQSTGNGLDVWSGAAVTAISGTISNNGGYAVIAGPGATVPSLETVTVTGNSGGNGNVLAYRGGTISGSQVWHGGAPMLVLGDVQIASGAALAVDPGTTVKMSNQKRLTVYGTLAAAGTEASPIALTSSQATPAPGNWWNLYFSTGGNPASQLSYVTVAYAGYWDSVGIDVASGSPVLDHVTVTNTAGIGVRLTGGSLSITDSTITQSTGVGLDVRSGAAVTAISGTISDNGGYAVIAGPGAAVGPLGSVTMTGNSGGNGNVLAYRAGTINGTQAWHGGAPMLTLGDLEVASGADLTVDAGTTVKMANGTRLKVYGKLAAVGTEGSPIAFTSSQATPAPGNWWNLYFSGGANPASQLSYVTVAYAGYWDNSGIYLQSGTLGMDHVNVSHTAGSGIKVTGGTSSLSFSSVSASTGTAVSVSGSPSMTIVDSAFTGNAAGVTNSNPANVLDARFNYWGAVTGPSGAGPGSGQSVSTGVVFEPWLGDTVVEDHYYTSATPTNRTFNPTIGIDTTIDFTTTQTGSWTVTILDSGQTTVKTFSGSGASGSATWDGTDAGQQLQPHGTYTYRLDSVAAGDLHAAPVEGLMILDTTITFAITDVVVSPLFFSPNGDGSQDTSTVTANVTFECPSWTVEVKDSSETVVRSVTGSGQAIAFVWDGKDAGGYTQQDGVYTFALSAQNGGAFASASATVTLDNTAPSAVMTAPAPSQPVSNIYQDGETDFDVIGTATDANLLTWTLDYGAGPEPTSWTVIATGSTGVTDALLGTWHTGALPNGTYTVRLQVWDEAGTRSVASSTVPLGNFSASQDVLEFNGGSSGVVNYTSVVPFTLHETLVIKNELGQVVRTLVDTQRTADTYMDPWNGRDDTAALVPDGPYFYVITVSEGESSLTWDLSTEYLDNYSGSNDNLNIQPADPFNNQPLTFTYNFPVPGNVTVAVVRHYLAGGECDQPPENALCLTNRKYEESGPHTFTWAGVDASGAFVASRYDGLTLTSLRDRFAKNAVVLYGTKPTLEDVAVNPPAFDPSMGTTTVSFDFATYQSQAADLSVTFLNQSSLSVLRTIELSAQTPGYIEVAWDGRADNGMFVAPGYYTVTVTVTDPIGNQVQGQILATVRP